MRKLFYFCYFTGIFLWTFSAEAQTREQRQQIMSHYDFKVLNVHNNPYIRNFRTHRQQALQYARLHRIPLTAKTRDGRTSYFARIDERGNHIYLKSYNNVDAARTIGVDKLYKEGSLGLDLSGRDMIVGMWDEGQVRGTHELLSGKVEQKDDADKIQDHSTQVAGTIAGKKLSSGVGIQAQGMAYNARVEAYDWDDDMQEMYQAAQAGLLVSNHSYGPDLEQIQDPLSLLGVYNDFSEAVDNLAYHAPYYLPVIAAGNDRDAYQKYNPSDGGYNMLAGEMNTAKNTLVVAAVYGLREYTGPQSVQMTPFSSWGPTNDNRIKPDIAADGVNLLSSVATTLGGRPSDNQYDYYSGTSAAAPGVTGAVILLQELSAQLNQGEFLKASTVRAVIAATAREAGANPGPDPRFGWGLLDMEAAARLLLDNFNQRSSFYEEQTLFNGDTYTKKIKITDKGMLKAVIAWTDPAGKAQPAGVHPPVLVNDLDIRLTDESGNVYFPWRLYPDDFSAPALRDGDNHTDNIEQIFIDNPGKEQVFTLEVSHKNTLTDNQQDFALVVLGARPAVNESLKNRLLVVYPNPASDFVHIEFNKPVENFEINVFDLLGRKVFGQTVSKAQNRRFTLDTSGLSSGNYFIHVRTDEGKAVEQIIVR